MKRVKKLWNTIDGWLEKHPIAKKWLLPTILVIIICAIEFGLTVYIAENYYPSDKMNVGSEIVAARIVALFFSVNLGIILVATSLKFSKKLRDSKEYKDIVDTIRCAMYLYAGVFAVVQILDTLKINLILYTFVNRIDLSIAIALLTMYITFDAAIDIFFKSQETQMQKCNNTCKKADANSCKKTVKKTQKKHSKNS